LLIAAWFLAACGYLGNIYWIPIFVKRLSGSSDRAVTWFLVIPALIGIVGILANGWHSDKTKERRLHAAIPLLVGALLYSMAILERHNFVVAISFLLVGSGLFQAFYPLFWSLPTMILSESAAAASFGLINSIGQLGGLAGPYIVGLLNDRTQSVIPSFGFVALVFVGAASLILSLKIHDPLLIPEGSKLA